jgi:hypothetical protein
MKERFTPKVGVTKFNGCHGCTYSQLHFKNKTPEGNTIYDAGTYTCRIASLEKKLGRIPTFGEITNTLNFSLDLYQIPEGCRNRYRNFMNLKSAPSRE